MSRGGFPRDVVELVLGRSGGSCEIMATGCTLLATEIHHRRPRGMGSTRRPETNHASNALHVCRRCHLRAEAHRTWALNNGFLVRQSDHPDAVPVWWRCSEHGGHKDLVLLDDTGHTIPTTARTAQ